MWQYISLNILIMMFSFLDLTNLEMKVKKLNLYISSFFLILLAGLRYKTGADIHVYRKFFDLISRGVSWVPLEKGYIILNSLFIKLGLSFELLIFFISFLTICLVMFFIKREACYWSLSIFIFYSQYFLRGAMGNIRQMLAMSILLYSYKYVSERKIIKFLLIIFLAGSLHRSAFVFIPFYFLLNKKYTKKQMIVLVFLSIIISRTNIILYLFNLLLKLEKIGFDLKILYKITHYFFERRGNSSLLVLGAFERLFFISLFIFLKDKIYKQGIYYRIYFNSYFYSILIFFLFSIDLHIASRVARIFQITEILLIPLLVKLINPKELRVIIYILVLFLYTGHFIDELMLVLPEYGGYVYLPYRSILELFF